MKKNLKQRLLSLLLCLSLSLSLVTPVMALSPDGGDDTAEVSVEALLGEDATEAASEPELVAQPAEAQASDSAPEETPAETPSEVTEAEPDPAASEDDAAVLPSEDTDTEDLDAPSGDSETPDTRPDTEPVSEGSPTAEDPQLPADPPALDQSADAAPDTETSEEDASEASEEPVVEDAEEEVVLEAEDEPEDALVVAGPLRAAASGGWEFWQASSFSNDAGNANCYLLHGTRSSGQKGYGINLHRARNTATGAEFWAYCLDHDRDSSATPDSNYTVDTLPSSAKYQVAQYIIGLGYGNSAAGELNALFGYDMNNWEWAQATQAAIWIAQYVADGTYSNVDNAMTSSRLNIRLTSQHSDSDARNAAKALALAGLALWQNGSNLTISSPTKVTETTTSITYRVTISPENLYGGYSGTISGLPSGSVIAGSSNVTVSTTALSSTTVTGTDTLTIRIPKSDSAQTAVVRLSLSSAGKRYETNGAVLYAKSGNSANQDFVVSNGAATASVAAQSLQLPVPRLATGRITITKKDAVTGETVPNVTFELYEYNGTKYVATGKTATTDAAGVATFTDLVYSAQNQGRYEVFEKSSATHRVYTNHYVIDVNLTNGKWAAYTSSDASQTSGTVTQSSSGDYDYSFTITVKDPPKAGSITVVKRDAETGQVLPGCVFRLYAWQANSAWDSNSGKYVDTGKTVTTDSSGSGVFSDLTVTSSNCGKFQVREDSAPSTHVKDASFSATAILQSGTYNYVSSLFSKSGSLPDGGSVTGKINGTDHVAVIVASTSAGHNFTLYAYDQPKTGSITVVKRDAETGKVLPGCVFRLYAWQANSAWDSNSGKYVDTGKTVTTDSSGSGIFSDLTITSSNCGKFQVREDSAPEGYEKDASFVATAILQTGTYRYVSSLVSQSGTLASGGTVTGKINSRTKTIVVIDATSKGYDFTLYLDDHKAKTWANITVSKIVKDASGETVYLSGATFGLYKYNGSWAAVYTLVEDDRLQGVYAIPEDSSGTPIYTLLPNTRYKVVEESAPAGVINIGWEQEFVWDESDSDLELSFTCEDTIPTGALQIKKTDAETGLPLTGITFSVTAAKDISYTLNGKTTVLYPAGAEIGTLTTGEDGTAELTGLYYGTYTLTETSTLENYRLDETTFTAVIGAPKGYDAAKTYPESAAIGVTTYSGVATVTDYEEYHVAEYGKYVKDSSGYVIRYNKDANGSYTKAATGKYAQVTYASVTNTPLHPKMSVAKLADRTTDPKGGAVDFDAESGRYTEEKIPGTYYDRQTVTFTLTATNTGNVALHNLYMVDQMSAPIWTVVENSKPQNTDPAVRTTDVTFRDADGAELKAGSTVSTTAGDTATIQSVAYDDVAQQYIIRWDKLAVGDSVHVYLTFTLYNYDAINKNALPNDVYLYGQYLSNGTSGTMKDVPGGGEDEYDCHDKDAINVVSVGSITIHKADSNGAVEGAVFQLTDSDGRTVQFVHQEDGSYAATVVAANGDWVSAARSGRQTVTEIVTDRKGYAELVNVPVGTYTLTETATTSGHTLLAEPVTITLPYVVEGSHQAEDAVTITGSDGIVRTYRRCCGSSVCK